MQDVLKQNFFSYTLIGNFHVIFFNSKFIIMVKIIQNAAHIFMFNSAILPMCLCAVFHICLCICAVSIYIAGIDCEY